MTFSEVCGAQRAVVSVRPHTRPGPLEVCGAQRAVVNVRPHTRSGEPA